MLTDPCIHAYPTLLVHCMPLYGRNIQAAQLCSEQIQADTYLASVRTTRCYEGWFVAFTNVLVPPWPISEWSFAGFACQEVPLLSVTLCEGSWDEAGVSCAGAVGCCKECFEGPTCWEAEVFGMGTWAVEAWVPILALLLACLVALATLVLSVLPFLHLLNGRKRIDLVF